MRLLYNICVCVCACVCERGREREREKEEWDILGVCMHINYNCKETILRWLTIAKHSVSIKSIVNNEMWHIGDWSALPLDHLSSGWERSQWYIDTHDIIHSDCTQSPVSETAFDCVKLLPLRKNKAKHKHKNVSADTGRRSPQKKNK